MDLDISKDFNFNELLEIAIPYGIKVLGAVAIFIIGRFVAKVIKKISRKAFVTAKLNATLSTFLSNVIYSVILAFVVIAALNNLGVETTSLAAILGAAGLAVGLAFKDSIGNIAAGIMIVVLRPFNKGDFIEAAGASGTVENIDIFVTELITPDNKKVIIPNGNIFGSIITNYHATPTRRIDLVFGIGYDDDLKKAKKILEKITAADNRILKDPTTFIGVSELGDSSVNIVCRPWVKNEDFWQTKCDLTEQVKLAFDEAGITIPYPQREITTKAVKPKTVEKPKATKNKSQKTK